MTECTSLVATCMVYVLPHCSEGLWYDTMDGAAEERATDGAREAADMPQCMTPC